MQRRSFLGKSSALAAMPALAAVSGCATISPAEQIAALMREGQAALQAKRYDEALAKFQQVIGRDPRHWAAYVGLARGYLGKLDWTQAVQSARQAYQIAPTGQDVVPVLAEALFGGGTDALKGRRFQEAIGLLVEYVKIQPSHAEGFLSLGRAFLGHRDFRGALDAFIKGIGLSTGPQREEFVRSLLDGGRQALSANDPRGAIGLLREYLKADRGNVTVYLDLAKAYWNAGDRSEAVDAFREVLRLNPGNAEALRFLLQR